VVGGNADVVRYLADALDDAWQRPLPAGTTANRQEPENRIDHIFFSPNLAAQDPQYILPPESATDHPVHWTEIIWE
jgi:endonuclease/exonuclease/phosphatase family metal-dependent hydrolase